MAVPERVDLPLLDIVEHLLGVVGGVSGQHLPQQPLQVALLLLRQRSLLLNSCTPVTLLTQIASGESIWGYCSKKGRLLKNQ